jgi:hypothetical protein
MKKNTQDNFFLAISVLVLGFSLVGAFNTYSNVAGFTRGVTGYAVDVGSVNVTVQETTLLNFTSHNINWGSGAVTEGHTSAMIDTYDGGIIEFGTWNPVGEGFVIRNEGNVNVSLNLTNGKNAASFIGGTNPYYKFRVNNVEEGACTPPADFELNGTYDAGVETVVCNNFVSNSSIRVEISYSFRF